MPPPNIHLYVRRPQSNQGIECPPTHVHEDLASAATGELVGLAECRDVGAGDNFVLIKGAGPNEVLLYPAALAAAQRGPTTQVGQVPDATRPTVWDVHPTPDGRGVSATIYPDDQALTDHYTEVHAKEPGVLRTVEDRTESPGGPFLEIGVGIGGGKGTELSPLEPGLRGAAQSDERDPFGLLAFSFDVRGLLPNHVVPGWHRLWKVVCNPAIHFTLLDGEGNTHVSGSPDSHGAFGQFWFELSLLGVRFSTDLLYDQEPDWSFAIGADFGGLEVGRQWGRWAAVGHALPTDVDVTNVAFSRHASPYVTVRFPITDDISGFVGVKGMLPWNWADNITGSVDGQEFAARAWGLFGKIGVSFGDTKVTVTTRTEGDATVTLQGAGQPRMRERPVEVVPPPPPPREPKLPDFGDVELGEESGAERELVLDGIATAKISLRNDQTSAVDGLLAQINDLRRRLRAPDLFEVVLELEGSADSRSSDAANARLSLGRAFAVGQAIMEIAQGRGHTFIRQEWTRSVGVGEARLLDVNKQLIDRTQCKESGTFKGRGDEYVRVHTCKDKSKREELLAANRRVRVVARIVPRGAPLLRGKEDQQPGQLALDKQVGPALATALGKAKPRGGARFIETTYDPVRNRLYVAVDTLDPGKLRPLANEFNTIGARVQKTTARKETDRKIASFPVEIVYTGSEPGFAKTLQEIFYDFRKSPYAGGVVVSAKQHGERLKDFATQAKAREEEAARQADQALAQGWTGPAGTQVYPLPLAPDGTVDELTIITAYRTLRTLQRRVEPHQAVYVGVYYRHDRVATDDQASHPLQLLGYAARTAKTTPVRLQPAFTPRRGPGDPEPRQLANGIYLVTTVGAADKAAYDAWHERLDLSDPKNPLRDDLIKALLRE